MSKLRWIVAAVVAVAVLVVGGTWVYINVIREDAPPPLALEPTPDAGEDDGSSTSTTAADTGTADGLDGTWTVAADSVVGYRVDEILFGQSVEAVGRTSDVEGTLEVAGTAITAAEFTVDMATVTSDEGRRDGQFRGRIMDVANHPTATLVLAEPIDLGDVPADGQTVTATATVELTLRGTTRQVPMELEGRALAGRIEIVGSLTIVFDDWGIPNPSAPGIDTADEGVLEALLVLERA